jgi:hypothetical protein
MAELVDGLRIETVRGGPRGDLADRILDFWSAHGALDADAGRERLDQVVCALLDESGQVTGVNSVYAEDLPLISNNRFWVYRCYFKRAVWLPANYLFISENQRGAHARVRYFPGAQAPVPS